MCFQDFEKNTQVKSHGKMLRFVISNLLLFNYHHSNAIILLLLMRNKY